MAAAFNKRKLHQHHLRQACRYSLAAAILLACALLLLPQGSIPVHEELPLGSKRKSQQAAQQEPGITATVRLHSPAPTPATPHAPLRVALLPSPAAPQPLQAISAALRSHSPPWVQWQAHAGDADVLLRHISNCSQAPEWAATRQQLAPLAGGQAVVLLQHTLQCFRSQRDTLLRRTWKRALLAVGPHDLEAYAAVHEPQLQDSLRLWSMPWGEDGSMMGKRQNGAQGSNNVSSGIGGGAGGSGPLKEKLLLVAVAGDAGTKGRQSSITTAMAALLSAADKARFMLQPACPAAAAALSQQCASSSSSRGLSCHHKDGHQHLLHGGQLHDAIARAQYVVLLQAGDAWSPLAVTAAMLGTRMVIMHQPDLSGHLRWLKPYASMLDASAGTEVLGHELGKLLQSPYAATTEIAHKALAATFSWQSLVPALFDRIWDELQRHRFPQTVDASLLLLPRDTAASTSSKGGSTGSAQPSSYGNSYETAPGGSYEADQGAMARLLDACIKRGNHTIAWDLGKAGAEPWACAPVDVIMPHFDRGHGLCQDAVQYTYHLRGRMVSLELLNSRVQVQGKLVPYPAACPHSVWLNLEAVYPEVLREVHTNPARRLWYMINHETFNKDTNKTTQLLMRADRFLMKTRDGYARLQAWLQHNAARLPRRGDKVLTFTSHSTLDPTVGTAAGQHMDFTRALQISGGSGLKHTPELMHGWAMNPDLPMLTLATHSQHFLTLFDEYAHDKRGLGSPVTNMRMLRSERGNDVIRDLVNGIGIHICPSGKEGYGHYINQARAAGALVLATGYPPMSDLIGEHEEYGLACRYSSLLDEPTELLGPAGSPFLPKIDVHFEPEAIIACVRRALALPVAERRRRGAAARARYLAEQRYFVSVLHKLRQEAMLPRTAGTGGVFAPGALPGMWQTGTLSSSVQAEQ